MPESRFPTSYIHSDRPEKIDKSGSGSGVIVRNCTYLSGDANAIIILCVIEPHNGIIVFILLVVLSVIHKTYHKPIDVFTIFRRGKRNRLLFSIHLIWRVCFMINNRVPGDKEIVLSNIILDTFGQICKMFKW